VIPLEIYFAGSMLPSGGGTNSYYDDSGAPAGGSEGGYTKTGL